MLSRIKQYISEMGITDNFYEQMINTDPTKMVIYRGDYTNLVPKEDPEYEESRLPMKLDTTE